MLNKSQVHRNLDSSLTILGLEVFDLLALVGLAGIMNLIFGKSSLNIIFTIGLPSVLGGILYFGKKGKPEKFLIHAFKFYLLPEFFTASLDSKLKHQRKSYE